MLTLESSVKIATYRIDFYDFFWVHVDEIHVDEIPQYQDIYSLFAKLYLPW